MARVNVIKLASIRLSFLPLGERQKAGGVPRPGEAAVEAAGTEAEIHTGGNDRLPSSRRLGEGSPNGLSRWCQTQEPSRDGFKGVLTVRNFFHTHMTSKFSFPFS